MELKVIHRDTVSKQTAKSQKHHLIGGGVDVVSKAKITEKTFAMIQLEQKEIEEIIEDTEYGSW